ncbi:unnamed protein product [Hymenolepis diminuta]|uniref:BZIP domain-containing protein n=1 Tax=Hymenolepis diminuta TaxID=6216 RepID=A0A0R3SVE2_HYMDI|nr:unnamed protein product [Hymenolepis diminuta]
MNRIRHASLEQTPTPPERLPRLVLPSAVSNPVSPPRRHQDSEGHDFTPPYFPPKYPGYRISEDITTKVRHPSDQLTHSHVASSSPPQKYLTPVSMTNAYDNNNTYTGAATDARRFRNANLPSVISGVAVNSFQEEWQSNGDDAEKRKRFNLKEFRQRRRERRDSKSFLSSESDNNAVSVMNF